MKNSFGKIITDLIEWATGTYRLKKLRTGCDIYGLHTTDDDHEQKNYDSIFLNVTILCR